MAPDDDRDDSLDDSLDRIEYIQRVEDLLIGRIRADTTLSQEEKWKRIAQVENIAMEMGEGETDPEEFKRHVV